MFIRPMQFRPGPLVTMGSATDDSPGALGQPGTTVLYGTDAADFKHSNGFRLAVGTFLDKEARYSLELAGFVTFANTQEFSTTSDAHRAP